MSHDRGCPCGREKLEYDECEDPSCTKRPKKLDCNVVADSVDLHRGEHWYRCTTCGRTDWCAVYDRFERTEPLLDCRGTHHMKEADKRYVRVMNDGTSAVLTLEELVNVPASVKIYELGPEVKVKTRIEAVPVETQSHTGRE